MINLIRTSLPTTIKEKAFSNKVILSILALCIASLVTTRTYAVDFQGTTMSDSSEMEKDLDGDSIGVSNKSGNKIKVCVFNGDDKMLLIPSSESNIRGHKQKSFACRPNDNGKCKVRFLTPGTNCNDSSWPKISAPTKYILNIDKWNGISDSSLKVSNEKDSWEFFNGKVKK